MVYVYKKSFAAGEVLRAADVNTYLTSSRNLLLNGDFSINQRAYVSGANLASGVFGFDRWKSNFTNTTLTYTSAPQGQMVTINSGGGLKQVVEQANIVSNSYTLSWDGTAQGRVYKSGTTAPAYASSPITVSLDGTGNVDVEFTASGGTKTLHNVQLEIGSSATPFSRAGGTIQGELAACQRYYQVDAAQTYLNATSAGLSNSYVGSKAFLMEMRTTPTLTIYPADNLSGVAGKATMYPPGTAETMTVEVLTNKHFQLVYPGISTYNLAIFTWKAEAEL